MAHENHTNASATRANTQTKALASVWLEYGECGTMHNKMFMQCGGSVLMDSENFENLKNNQVLKHYGIAMFHAQLLETQTVNMIILARHFNAKNGKDKKTLNELFEDYDYGKRTFGVLINELKSFYKLDEQDKVDLEQLLGWRNYLAHDYFKFNIMLLSTDMGRKRMIQDFKSFVAKVETLDDRLETYVQDFYSKQGITTKELDMIVDNTTEELKKKIIGPDWVTKI